VLWGYPFTLVCRLILAFTALLAFCFAATYILSQPTNPVTILIHLVPVALAILLAMYVAEVVGVTVRPLPPLTIEALFWSIATACLTMALGYAILPTYAPSTSLALSAPVLSGLAVFLQRRWLDARGVVDDAVPALLFAGNRADAAHGLAELTDAPGLAIRAAVLPALARDRSPMAGLPVDTPKDALERMRRERVRLFVVARAPATDLQSIVATCAGAGCVVETVDELVAKAQGRVNLTSDADIDLLNRLTTQANRFSIQRQFDVLFALLALAPTLLLCLLTAIAVKLSSRGPVLFTQRRVGRWGRPFRIYKFRTMTVDEEKETGPVWASDSNPRVTKLGRFLRTTRLDEMPQILNVLLGDMSLVGPRPERPYFVETLRRKIPLYDARHSVRPGITGWAQIRYAYGASEEDAQEKLSYELFYILNRSTTFYLTVLLETVKVILFRRGSR